MSTERLQDRYQILRPIGQGAMGTVYEARVIATGERVAIKWLHARPFAANDPDLARFTQEARIVGALRSPHVLRVIELAQDRATMVPYQVMELLRGEDVGALLRRVGALSPDAALRVAAQASMGLAAAHAKGVVHRDVKPENLFLASGAAGEITVKVLDFGMAKIRRTAGAAAAAGLTVPAQSMTASGQLMGTPLFMAVELLDGARHADARSDVYSMGVTLFALLAGTPPRAGATSLVSLLHALVNEPPPSITEAAPWVPVEVAAVVEKAMRPAKEERYRDGAELAEALSALLPGGVGLRAEMLAGAGGQGR